MNTHRPEFGYVLTATAAALYGMGHYDAAVTTIDHWGSGLPVTSDYLLAVQILAAAAITGKAGRS